MRKHILLIATGGTIASSYSEQGGLAPSVTTESLLRHVPELSEICRISAVQMYNLDSTNMRPEYWLEIAKHIEKVYDEYDGFVIAHGTDTMAYASALLYYLIQNSKKPIVLTGAQIPIERRDTDARENLTDAFLYACDDNACGVHIVFDGKVITGTRARKNRTKSFNAFSSIDYPEVAFVRDGRVRYYIKENFIGPAVFSREIDPKVAVIKLVPGMSADIFDYVADKSHAVIIESFGVGGLPYYDNDEFADKIRLLTEKGVRIVMTTQVPHEGSDMEIYRVGFRIKHQYELAEAYCMTTEAVLAKIMWILPQISDGESFRRMFSTPVGNDII